MAQFSVFSLFLKLPKELQLQIWKMAIQADSEITRLVLMDGTYLRIRPTPQLISPFFSVNLLSRQTAFQYYPTKLDVYDDIPGSCTNNHPGEKAGSKGCIYLNMPSCAFYVDYMCLGYQMYMFPSSGIRHRMASGPRGP